MDSSQDHTTLWIFGQSACTGYNLENPADFWGNKFADSIGCHETLNFAQPGCDNLYIYHTIVQNYKKIKSKDIVIVGWSHPNRKTFVLEKDLDPITQANSLMYPGSPVFFRSTPKFPNDAEKWSRLQPINKGVVFYDRYFTTYHSSVESKLNFQAYLTSARALLKAHYLPFYFSKESIQDIDVEGFYWFDWIIANQVWISESDLHPNQKGHELLADVLIDLYNTIR